MIHGEKQTRKIKVGSGAVYTKTVRFCLRHGWMDTFTHNFDRYHAGCGADDVKTVEVGILPRGKAAA